MLPNLPTTKPKALSPFFVFLRGLAAIMMSASGVAHVGALWFRELSHTAVQDALLGTTYLIIGIGLFGQSRFSLVMAVVIPAVFLWFALYPAFLLDSLLQLRLAVHGLIALFCLVVLWQVRNNPSV